MSLSECRVLPAAAVREAVRRCYTATTGEPGFDTIIQPRKSEAENGKSYLDSVDDEDKIHFVLITEILQLY